MMNLRMSKSPAQNRAASLPGKTPRSAIWAVNFNSLLTFAAGFGAWAAWPDRAEHWRSGFLSLLLAAMCIAGIIGVFKAITKIYAREREIAALMAEAKTQHSSELANRDALKNVGMIDG